MFLGVNAYMIGWDRVKQKLDPNKIKRRADDLPRRIVDTIVMRVAEEFVYDATSRIDKRIDPDGNPQKKNPPAYAAWKLRTFGHSIPLRREGQLANPLLYGISAVGTTVTVRPPPNRINAIENVNRKGYRFFYLPNESEIDGLIIKVTRSSSTRDIAFLWSFF